MPLWVWKQRSVSICSWVRRCPEGQSHTTRWWEIQNSLSHWCVWGRRRFQEVGRELTANTRNCLKLRNQIWPKDIWSADHLENPDSDCWCTTQWNCTMSSLIMYDTEEKKMVEHCIPLLSVRASTKKLRQNKIVNTAIRNTFKHVTV